MDLKDTVSGICGAFCCTYAGLPFDVAKVRLQNQAAGVGAYSGTASCIAHILRHEGPLTLYRGALPALSSACAENAMGITVQRATHRQLVKLHGDPSVRFSLGTECAIGGFTGIFTSMAMCPFEVAKVRMQVLSRSGAGASQDLFSCVSEVYRNGGLRGFYRGLTSLLARDVPFNAIFFGSYEFACTQLMRYNGCSSKDGLSTPQVLLAGGLAGATGWSVVIPFDVVKTRLQTGQASGSCFHVMRTIIAREGYRKLFAGWSAAVMRALPANAAMFAGVELSNRWLQEMMSGGRIENKDSTGVLLGLATGTSTAA